MEAWEPRGERGKFASIHGKRDLTWLKRTSSPSNVLLSFISRSSGLAGSKTTIISGKQAATSCSYIGYSRSSDAHSRIMTCNVLFYMSRHMSSHMSSHMSHHMSHHEWSHEPSHERSHEQSHEPSHEQSHERSHERSHEQSAVT